MKKILTATLLTLLYCGVSAQEPNALELSWQRDNQGNYVIEVSRHEGGIYNLVLELYDLENIAATKFQRWTVVSRRKLVVLKPEDPEKRTNFRYRYRYIIGSVNPRKVDMTFVYRLPFGLSESREAHLLYNFTKRHFGVDSRSVSYNSFQFIMNRADTVYAARKGKVIWVVDRHDPLLGMGEISMNTDSNKVHVEHTDGTIAVYNVLEKGSITVEPGDTVYPGTPIGLAGTLDGEIYQLRFSLFYQTDNLSIIKSLSDYSVTLNYIDPIFATTNGETALEIKRLYKPVCTEEMITREMTKRELKTRKQ